MANRIRELRVRQNMTQRELAEAVEASTVDLIRRWEQGTTPHPRYRRRLARVLGVTIAELGLRGSDPSQPRG